MKQSIEDIKGTLTRRKMQARQIHPNAIIVPYDRAMKAIDNVVRYYEDKIEKEFIQIVKSQDHDKEEDTKEEKEPGDTGR